VENIITLTFTEKAAQEMKERIESVIMEKISSATENELVILRRALSHFDDANVSTIHSFASKVLKESAVALGLDPASSIISQPQADELAEELGRKIEELDEVVTKNFKNSSSLEAILSEWLPQNIADLSIKCEEIHSARSCSYKEFLNMSDDSVMANVIRKIKKNSMPKIISACENWQAVLYGIKDQIYSVNKGKIPDYIFNLREFLEKWSESVIESDEEFINFFIALMESVLKRADFGILSESINSYLGEPAKEWKKRYSDLLTMSRNFSIDRIKTNYPQDLSEREALIELCSVCWRISEEKRRENKTLSFTDLIVLASEGISNNNYSRNSKQIMIDEFQDTDPLQEKMIRLVAGNQPDTSIFVVGDPKQSIYRFRNADLSIFESYVSESRKKQGNDINGVYIKMNDSFRMRSGLIHRINGLFNYIWPNNLGESIGNLKYENLAGEVDEKRDAGTLPIMAMLSEKHESKSTKKEFDCDFENEGDRDANPSVGDERGAKGKIDEVRARLLKKLTETLIHWKTRELTLWDKNDKCLRPFEWRDCAILTMTRTSWALIEDAFSKADIPLSIEGNVSWFVRGEVMDIINMLRAVAFPDDELSNGGWYNSFLSPRDKNEEGFLRRTASIKGGAAALNYFLDNLYWLKNLPASQRLRALANMRYALQLAEDYERLICRSIHGCSEWLLKALKSKSRFEEPQTTDDGKSVKLLTVHASKGLEFPFVIIFGTERLSTAKRISSSLIASEHLGLFASKHELFKMFHYALEEQAQMEEYQRLLYVAATRAEDSVLFCGITDEKYNAESGSWLQYLINWNANSNSESIVSVDSINEMITSSLFPEKTKSTHANITVKNNHRLSLPEPEVSLTRISATSYALFEWCPHAWRRKYRQGIDVDFENIEGADRGSVSGKNIGSISHWILSKWDFSVEGLNHYFPIEKLTESVISLLPPSLRAAYRVSSNREKIRQWLAGFADSEIGEQFRKLCSESKLKREVPFRILVAKGIELVGTFDVFWEDGNRIHLRDWKTNPNDRVLELYKNQLFFYAYALHRLKGNLSTIGLVSIKDSKLFEIVDSESFDRIENIIVKAAKKAVTGLWERKTENCLMCPWKNCDLTNSMKKNLNAKNSIVDAL
jgi:ATP-dependent exoDNAse (exonuclease V) beta subunit